MHSRVWLHPVRRVALAFGTITVLVPALVSVSGCGAGRETEADDAPLGRAAEALSAPVCVSIQRGVSGAVADAQIVSDRPTTNYGTKSAANVNGGAVARQLLLRFDLSAIPANVTVTSANLTLTAYQSTFGASGTLRAHRILSPWTESVVTFGLFKASFLPAVEASAINHSSGYAAPTSFDLTALTQGWVSGASANQGVLLEQPETTTTGVSMSEAVSASTRPRLDVCYQPRFGTSGGYSASALVAGGTTMSSPSYSAVMTLGQSPGGASTALSSSYRFHGGLVGGTQGP